MHSSSYVPRKRIIWQELVSGCTKYLALLLHRWAHLAGGATRAMTPARCAHPGLAGKEGDVVRIRTEHPRVALTR